VARDGRFSIDPLVAHAQFDEIAPVAVLYTASLISYVIEKEHVDLCPLASGQQTYSLLRSSSTFVRGGVPFFDPVFNQFLPCSYGYDQSSADRSVVADQPPVVVKLTLPTPLTDGLVEVAALPGTAPTLGDGEARLQACGPSAIVEGVTFAFPLKWNPSRVYAVFSPSDLVQILGCDGGSPIFDGLTLTTCHIGVFSDRRVGPAPVSLAIGIRAVCNSPAQFVGEQTCRRE